MNVALTMEQIEVARCKGYNVTIEGRYDMFGIPSTPHLFACRVEAPTPDEMDQLLSLMAPILDQDPADPADPTLNPEV